MPTYTDTLNKQLKRIVPRITKEYDREDAFFAALKQVPTLSESARYQEYEEELNEHLYAQEYSNQSR